jgi:hypothetical protein
MAPPKGNQFWKLRDKSGRDRLFATPEDFLDEAEKYFVWCDGHPWMKREQKKQSPMSIPKTATPEQISEILKLQKEVIEIETQRPYTIEGLCLFLGITTVTFYDYKKSKGDDFSNVFTYVQGKIRAQQIEGAQIGVFNANLTARINGIRDNIDVKEDIKIKQIKTTFETSRE